MMQYFDYESVAREASISEKDLLLIRAEVRKDFPSDEMMFELHMLRACRAIRDGDITLDQVIGRKAA